MVFDAEKLRALVEADLARIQDMRVTRHIRSLLVEPRRVPCDWHYGEKGQQYACWIILQHQDSSTGIAYTEEGFGPRTLWGLIGLEGPQKLSMDMDSGWFTTLLQAYLNSSAAAALPIWRMFKTDGSGARQPITPEGGWDETWKQVMAKREEDLASQYDCGTSVSVE